MTTHTTHALLKEDGDLTACGLPLMGEHLVINGPPTCECCARITQPSRKRPANPLSMLQRTQAKEALTTALLSTELEEKWKEARSKAIDARISLVLSCHSSHDPFAMAQRLVDMAARNGDRPTEEWT